MKSLEEKIHELCKRGELVHLSLAAVGDTYRAIFAAASPLGGYATGCDPDPVRALLGALSAPIVKAPRAAKHRDEVEDAVEEPTEEATVTVNEPKPERSARLRSYM